MVDKKGNQEKAYKGNQDSQNRHTKAKASSQNSNQEEKESNEQNAGHVWRANENTTDSFSANAEKSNKDRSGKNA